MQRYSCVICKGDAAGGGSLIHEGMFFKLCAQCLEDEEAVRLINEYMMQIEDEDEVHQPLEDYQA